MASKLKNKNYIFTIYIQYAKGRHKFLYILPNKKKKQTKIINYLAHSKIYIAHFSEKSVTLYVI